MDNKKAAGIGVATAVGLSVITGQIMDTAPTNAQVEPPVIEAQVAEYVPPTPVEDDPEYAPATTITDELPAPKVTTESFELPTEEEPPKKKFYERVKEKVKATFSRKKKAQVSTPVQQTQRKKRRTYATRKYNPISFRDHNRQVDGRNIIPEGIKADFSRYKG